MASAGTSRWRRQHRAPRQCAPHCWTSFNSRCGRSSPWARADPTALYLAEAMDVTTVADDLVVLHDANNVIRHEGLDPDRTYRFSTPASGVVEVHTLRRPAGELLRRLATVHDVH